MEIGEKIQFVQKALTQMAPYTHPFIASIVGDNVDLERGPHVGSGFRLSARRRCIVTAAHVASEARDTFGRVGVSAARGSPPILIKSTPDLVDEERDLAVFFVGDDYPAELIDFWPSTRIDHDEAKLSTDFLVVHGFPGVRSRFSALANQLVNASLPYGVMRRDDDLPRDLQEFQFAMDFNPENFRDPTGRLADWLDPRGLSGSPVWRIGASGTRIDEWTPELSTLVGIITQWRPDERIIVATKAQALVDLLAQ